jgi:reductive dehalogenase
MSIPISLGRDDIVDPPVADEKVPVDPADLANRVKEAAKFFGADLVGVTKLDPLWVYSNRAQIYHDNWEDWGKENPVKHQNAIVIGVELPWEMTATAPHTTSYIGVMEGYSKLAKISVQVATFLAEMGYSSRAHNLRNYQVVLVPLAIDAGLAELGRAGYALSKKYGPRVKWAVVTTDAPLALDKPQDFGIQDFCSRCKKCARICPTKSIPLGEKTVDNGIRRWILDPDPCFGAWNKFGTDCGICLANCPWSHPGTIVHRLGSWMASRSVVARIGLVGLEDLFYGDHLPKYTGPEWASYK